MCAVPNSMGSSEGRVDLNPMKIKIFEAMCALPSRTGLSPCKRWALYRNGFRLYMLGELAKCELDTIVLYTLGKDNVHLHNELVHALLHNSSLPKPPLVSTVLPYLDDAMRQMPEPPDVFSDDEDSDGDGDGEDGREEGLAMYETLRKALHVSGPAWELWPGGRLGLPRALDLPDRREAPTIPKPRQEVQDKAEEMECDAPPAPALAKGQDKQEEAKGGDTEEKGEGAKDKDKAVLPAGLLSLTCYGSSDEDSEEKGQATAQEGAAPKAGDKGEKEEEAQRAPGKEGVKEGEMEGEKEEDEEEEGDAEERLVEGWRQGAEEAPACLPTLALVHHTLMCAGSEGAGGGLVKEEWEEGSWGEGGALGVSMQATATLHTAAQEFTRRLLRRCVAMANQDSPTSSSSPTPPCPHSSSPNGRKRRAEGDCPPSPPPSKRPTPSSPSPPAPPTPSPQAAPKPLSIRKPATVPAKQSIDASLVLQSVEGPCLAPSLSLGRGFPSPDVTTDLYGLTHY